jgi:hypothetical protein
MLLLSTLNSEVFSPGFAVRGCLAEASMQVPPMCQRRVECCPAGAGAEELRLMSLRTRCSADQRRRPHS